MAPFNVQSRLSTAPPPCCSDTLKCSALCVVRHTRHRTGLPRRRTPTPPLRGRRTWAWSFCERSAQKEWTTSWKEFCRCNPASCLLARCLRPLCHTYALRQLRATNACEREIARERETERERRPPYVLCAWAAGTWHRHPIPAKGRGRCCLSCLRFGFVGGRRRGQSHWLRKGSRRSDRFSVCVCVYVYTYIHT